MPIKVRVLEVRDGYVHEYGPKTEAGGAGSYGPNLDKPVTWVTFSLVLSPADAALYGHPDDKEFTLPAGPCHNFTRGQVHTLTFSAAE